MVAFSGAGKAHQLEAFFVQKIRGETTAQGSAFILCSTKFTA
jgi:hypothetical protein